MCPQVGRPTQETKNGPEAGCLPAQDTLTAGEAERAGIGHSPKGILVGLELAPEVQRLVLPGPILVLGTGLHFHFLPLLDLKLTETWLAW